MAAFQKTFYMANWRQGKTNRTTPTTLQERMQARHLQALGINTDFWEVTATDRDAWRHTVKVGLSQFEETQRVKAEEKRLRKKTVCVANRPTTAFTCSKCVLGTATPESVFTATKAAAQWVQIYGLLRPTDANDDDALHRKLVSVMPWDQLKQLIFGNCQF